MFLSLLIWLLIIVIGGYYFLLGVLVALRGRLIGQPVTLASVTRRKPADTQASLLVWRKRYAKLAPARQRWVDQQLRETGIEVLDEQVVAYAEIVAQAERDQGLLRELAQRARVLRAQTNQVTVPDEPVVAVIRELATLVEHDPAQYLESDAVSTALFQAERWMDAPTAELAADIHRQWAGYREGN